MSVHIGTLGVFCFWQWKVENCARDRSSARLEIGTTVRAMLLAEAHLDFALAEKQ
jgi:hypothetical protein